MYFRFEDRPTSVQRLDEAAAFFGGARSSEIVPSTGGPGDPEIITFLVQPLGERRAFTGTLLLFLFLFVFVLVRFNSRVFDQLGVLRILGAYVGAKLGRRACYGLGSFPAEAFTHVGRLKRPSGFVV